VLCLSEVVVERSLLRKTATTIIINNKEIIYHHHHLWKRIGNLVAVRRLQFLDRKTTPYRFMFSENFVPIGLIRTTSIYPDPYRIHLTSKASRAFLLYTKENRPMRIFYSETREFHQRSEEE
jgi:hypothetical protein